MTSLSERMKEKGHDPGVIGALSLATDDLVNPMLVEVSLSMGLPSGARHFSLFVDAGDPRRNEEYTGISWAVWEKEAVNKDEAMAKIMAEFMTSGCRTLVLNSMSWNNRIIKANELFSFRSWLEETPVWYLSETEAVRECLDEDFSNHLNKDSLIGVMKAVVGRFPQCDKRCRLTDYAEKALGPDGYREYDSSETYASYMSDLLLRLATTRLSLPALEK